MGGGEPSDVPRMFIAKLMVDGKPVVATSADSWTCAQGPITYDSIYHGEIYDAGVAAHVRMPQFPSLPFPFLLTRLWLMSLIYICTCVSCRWMVGLGLDLWDKIGSKARQCWNLLLECSSHPKCPLHVELRWGTPSVITPSLSDAHPMSDLSLPLRPIGDHTHLHHWA